MRNSNVKLAVLWGVWMILAAAAWGQSSQASEPGIHSFDVALTFNASLNNNVPGDTFWMQGASAQVCGQFWRGLGVVADVGGLHTANGNGSGVGLDLVTVAFGPRYTWRPPHQRSTVFGQILAGETLGANSVFPSAAGISSGSNSLALIVGGGINIPVSRRLAVRALEADWLRTQLPNATTGVQNNLRLGAGVIFRFK